MADPVSASRWPAECPHPVERAAMLNDWNSLTFLHWAYEPDVVQQLLPPALKAETFGGSAWVGLVPFAMRVMRPPIGAVPWLMTFLETNVRTYVVGPDGTSGVWFFSLDASRLGVVAVARATYGVPYFWSKMRLRQRGDVTEYSCHRRWPGPSATSSVVVRGGADYLPQELSEFDHFLTARWQLFALRRSRIVRARADHQPWPLSRCEVLDVDDGLIEACGLPRPSGAPVAHQCRGIRVRLSPALL